MRNFVAAIGATLLLTGAASAGEITQEGVASFFRAGQDGNTQTASGEPVKPQENTAAHRTLPFNTIVTVTNSNTGKTVDVRITDRGPERTDRIIDVSESAARALGMETLGTAEVTLVADPAKQTDPDARRALEALAAKK